jgi:CubicO group peptidase (beta-lactamase class C family)
VQERRLSLDAPVHTVLQLPQVLNWFFNFVTVRTLLTHTSGVPSRPEYKFGLPAPYDKQDVAQRVANSALDYLPGSSSDYSNFGYVLAGMVAARMFNSSFLTALRNQVLIPLHADDIRLNPVPPATIPSDEASYDTGGLNTGRSTVDPSLTVPEAFADYDPGLYDASGGLSLPAPHFARVLACLNLRSGNPILSPSTIDLMLDNGLGWDSVSGARLRKGGGTPGTTAWLDYRRGGVGIAVSFNRDYVPDRLDALFNAINATSWPSTDLFPAYQMPSF